MKGIQTLKIVILKGYKRAQKKIDRFGYPIVQMTAPKIGKPFKVDLNDPNFEKTLAELKKQNSYKTLSYGLK
jgi:hypothetical protein